MTSGTSYSPPPAFGKFKLLHQIGAGVLGPVFRTQDPESDRLVAVKAFTLDITPEQAANLAAEFQRLVDLGLETPHLAVPVGTGVEDFVAYLASHYEAGESLDAAIRQYGPAPAGDAARLISHIAEAMDYGARVGVFHGALHPRDVLVTPTETHITGIGVAKALERIGLHGPIRRPYVAPERESGDEWGAAADVFSLAAISYEVLTGRRVLPGTDQPLAGLADLTARDTGALREVIESGLEADPERRPAHAADFAAAFANALLEGGVAPAAGDRAGSHRPRKPRARAPKLPGLDDPLTPASASGSVDPEPPGTGRGPSPATLDSPPPEDLAADSPAVPARELRYEPVDETPPETLADVQIGPREEPVTAPVVLESEAVAPEAARPEPERAPVVVAGPAAEPPLERLVEPRAEQSVEPAIVRQTDPVVDAPAELRVRMRRRRGLVTPAVVGVGGAVVPASDDVPRAQDERSPDGPPPGVPFPVAAASDARASASDVPSSPPEDPASATKNVHSAPDDSVPSIIAVMPGPAPAAARAISGAESLPFDLPGFGSEPVADDPVPQQLPKTPASVDDLRISFTPEAKALVEAGYKPDLRGLGEALSKLESTGRPARSGGEEAPADEWRDPGGLASEPAIPRAIDPLASSKAPRISRTLEPEPYRPELPVRPTRVPVAVGIGIGLLVAAMAGFLWWAGTTRPPSILPPGTVAEVRTPAAASTPAPGVVPPVTAKPPATATKPAAAAAPAPVPAPKAPASGAPAARAGTGGIRVRSTPSNAEVFVEGERRGVTPRSLRGLPYGTYKVRVARPGFVGQERQVTIDARHRDVPVNFTLVRVKAAAPTPVPGKPAAREAVVNPAAVVAATSISVETRPPGVRVRLDGKDVGVSPMTLSPVTPGSHRIDLSLAGYKRWSKTVTVAVGTRERITASLERDNPR